MCNLWETSSYCIILAILLVLHVTITKLSISQVLESMDPVSAVAAALAVLGDLNVEKWRKIKEDMRRSNRFVV